jgi:DNA-binding winged helix-turn-helix (wHTH) protein
VGRLDTKDHLVERLCEWGEQVSHNAIVLYIHRLRKNIEHDPIRIATVRGLGYCLEKIPPPRDACAPICTPATVATTPAPAATKAARQH